MSYEASLQKQSGEYVYEISFTSADSNYSYVVAANDGDIISADKELIRQNNVASDDSSGKGKTTDNKLKKSTDSTSPTDDSTDSKGDSGSTDNSGNSDSDSSSSVKSADSDKITTTKKDGKPKIKDSKPDNTSNSSNNNISNNVTDDTSGNSANKSQKNGSKTTTGKKSKTTDTTATRRYISVDKAKSVALKHAALKPSMVTFVKAVLDKEGGKIIYEIEFFTSKNEYEYEIDAYSGAILSSDIDKLSPSEKSDQTKEQNIVSPKNEDLEDYDDEDEDRKGDEDKDDDED